MISKKHLLLIGGIVLLLTGCGENAKEAPRVAPPTAPQTAVAPTEQLASTPDAHPVTEKIRDTYQWYCTQCHGVAGKGNGINAKLLTVPPRDHTKADYLETRSDQQLFEAIQQGGLAVGRAPCMPRWGNTLDEGTIHSLVRYIRELCKCEAI